MGFQLDKWELVNQIFLRSAVFTEARDLTEGGINLIAKGELYARWRACMCGSHVGNAMKFFTWLSEEVASRREARSNQARARHQKAKRPNSAD